MKALSVGSHVTLISDLNLKRQNEFIFGIVLHLHHIYVNFEYQGYWVKVKVISWKMQILLPGHQFNLV